MLIRLSIVVKLYAVVGAMFLALNYCCTTLSAGTPLLIIDDPETPGAQGWEVNITSSIENTRDGTLIEWPLFDINYGVADNDQLKIEFSAMSNGPSHDCDHCGIKDVNVGHDSM